MSNDLESRAREAASAARASIVSVTAQACRDEPPHRRPLARLGTALAATIVILGGAAALVSTRDTDTIRITTGPAVGPVTTLPPPPPGPPPQPSIGPVVGTGTAKDGRRWNLSIGGPSNGLCLHFPIDERTATGVCAGQPFDQPVPASDRYRPLLLGEARVPPYVFGLVPREVVEVEVELASGRRTPRNPVITGAGDGAYAVELERADKPTAVVGHRADGTTVRHPLRP